MNTETTVGWMNSISTIFSAIAGVHEMFNKRNAPCILNALVPIISNILQKDINPGIFNILKIIANDMIILQDSTTYLKRVPRSSRDAIESKLSPNDCVIQLSTGHKSKKSISFNRTTIIQSFQINLTKYIENIKQTELPELFLKPMINDSNQNINTITSITKENTESTNLHIFLDNMLKNEEFLSKIMIRHIIPGRSASYKTLPPDILHNHIQQGLNRMNIHNLYSHQVDAITSLLQDNKNIIVTTSTASGKSMCYILPILNSFYNNKSNSNDIDNDNNVVDNGNNNIDDKNIDSSNIDSNNNKNNECNNNGNNSNNINNINSSYNVINKTISTSINKPSITSFMIFPTKALAQDQLIALNKHINTLECSSSIRLSCYDGDIPQKSRSSIRENNEILLINPDILHMSILPLHKEWSNFLCRLKYIIIDEAHMYNGAFGIHVSCIIRRLRRIAAAYGSSPSFIICSATITNAVVHGSNITGICSDDFTLVDEDGSPCGEKEIILFNPFHQPNSTSTSTLNSSRAIKTKTNTNEHDLIQKYYTSNNNSNNSKNTFSLDENIHHQQQTLLPYECNHFQSAYETVANIAEKLIQHEIRTLIFVKARYIAEVLLQTIQSKLSSSSSSSSLSADDLKSKVAAYRGGYMPSDRRDIESKLKNGDLLVVITTNALELGIDVGCLDCTLHLGYPGSSSSFRQQCGRAGRAGQPSLAIYIALQSPLEQYFMNHPESFFQRPLDALLLHTSNETILSSHLLCAAYEIEFLCRNNNNNCKNNNSNNCINNNNNVCELSDEDKCSLLTKNNENGNENDKNDIYHAPVWFGNEANILLSKAIEERKLKLVDRLSSNTGEKFIIPFINKSYANKICIRSVDSFKIISVIIEGSGVIIETMQYSDALLWLYEGATHLHLGKSYEVMQLDLNRSTATVIPRRVNYYTQHVGHLSVKILGLSSSTNITYGIDKPIKECCGVDVSVDGVVGVDNGCYRLLLPPHQMSAMLRVGPVEVKKHVLQYRICDKRTGVIKDVIDVSQPAFVYNSRAVWCDIPQSVTHYVLNMYNTAVAAATPEDTDRHIDKDVSTAVDNGMMYGRFDACDDIYYVKYALHTIEHLICSLAPTCIPCDSTDLSCQHTRSEGDANKGFLLLFETQKGGFGLVEKIAESWFDLLKASFDLVRHCPCDSGCPSCCHIPSCGDFNEHLDKRMATLVLASLLNEPCTLPPVIYDSQRHSHSHSHSHSSNIITTRSLSESSSSFSSKKQQRILDDDDVNDDAVDLKETPDVVCSYDSDYINKKRRRKTDLESLKRTKKSKGLVL